MCAKPVEMQLSPEALTKLKTFVEGGPQPFNEMVDMLGLDPARDFRGADLRGMNLNGADLSGFDFTGADLTGATLKGAKVSLAIIDEKWMLDSLADQSLQVTENEIATNDQLENPLGFGGSVFIAHSSRDNFEAIALRDWLVSEGWSADALFVDLLSIGAGARWKEALARANERCEAVLFLVSPHSLASNECYLDIRMAEDMGKVIIPIILPPRVPEDLLSINDERLAIHRERQIVDASIEPRDVSFTVEHEGQRRTVAFHGPTLTRIKDRLEQLGISPTSFPWNPDNLKTATPYPGLEGFDQRDAALFFGRGGDIARSFATLRRLRKSAQHMNAGEVLLINAASGAGKSSFLKAGLWPRLERDPDFTPIAILRPSTGVLTGDRGLARQLAAFFERHDRAKPAAMIRQSLLGDAEVAQAALIGLLNEAIDIGQTTQRFANSDAPSPTPVIAVDQAEELFTPENREESEHFLSILAGLLKRSSGSLGLNSPLLIILTIRADSMDAALQMTDRVGLELPEVFQLPPIPRTAYAEIINEPLTVANRAGSRFTIDPRLTQALIEESEGADALPMLAYTLRQLIDEYRVGAKANLTLEDFQSSGGFGGLLQRRLAQALSAARKDQASLRRLLFPHFDLLE